MRDIEGRLSSSTEVSNTFLHLPVLRLYFIPFCIFPFQAFYLTLRAQLKVPSEEQSRTKLSKKPGAGKRGCSHQNACLSHAYGIVGTFPPFWPSALFSLSYPALGLLRGTLLPHTQPVLPINTHMHINSDFMPEKELCKPFRVILFFLHMNHQPQKIPKGLCPTVVACGFVVWLLSFFGMGGGAIKTHVYTGTDSILQRQNWLLCSQIYIFH